MHCFPGCLISWKVQRWAFCLWPGTPSCLGPQAVSSMMGPILQLRKLSLCKMRFVWKPQLVGGRAGTRLPARPPTLWSPPPPVCYAKESGPQSSPCLIGIIIIIIVMPTSRSDCGDSQSPCMWKNSIVKYSVLIAVSLEGTFICKVGSSPFVFNRNAQTSFAPLIHGRNYFLLFLSPQMGHWNI